MDLDLKQKLELGIKLPLKAPFLLRLFGKKQITFTIHPSVMTTGIDVGRIYVTIPRNEPEKIDETIKGLNGNANKIAKMAALTIMNNRFYGIQWLLVFPFARWLKNNAPLDKLWLISTLVLFEGLENFMNIIEIFEQTSFLKPNNSN